MIKVTKASEPITVENLCFTIYSQPGLGKTSLSFTASKPLMFDFDKGSYRAVDRKDVVQVSCWADVAGVTSGDLADYDTIIIDTVGKALDALAADIVKNNPKLGYGGALNQQGWGQLGVRFSAFLKHLKSMGKDIILISHMDEKSDGDEIKERLKIQGQTKDLVLTDSDVIARISIYNKERNLVFTPTETAFGKDPAAIGAMVVPDKADAAFPTCLADIITRIKDGLNALSEAQIERKSEIEWFTDQLPKMLTAGEINAVLGRAKNVGRDVGMMVVDRAKHLGFEFDPDAREYVELPNEDPQEKADQQ